MKKTFWTLMLLGLLQATTAGAAEKASLEDLVKNSDVIVLGQVLQIQQGQLDTELLKIGVNFRTDIAVVGVIEVLKGDPALKNVDIGFPGFPKAGEMTFMKDQAGIFLLTKSDQKYYEAKTAGRFLPQDKLGEVRRAIRAAAGLGAAGGAESRAERAAALIKELHAAPDEDSRRLTIYKLGDLGELSTVPVLIGALNDDAPDVRLAADIALRKITGQRAQVDFQDESADARHRAAAAWEAWWAANKDRTREDILKDAVEASRRPLPEFQYAIEGLAQSDDPKYQPLFIQALDTAVSTKKNSLAMAAATYLGKVKSRDGAKVAELLSPALDWTSEATRSAAADALSAISGETFGTGPEAAVKAFAWWQAHRDQFPQ